MKVTIQLAIVMINTFVNCVDKKWMLTAAR